MRKPKLFVVAHSERSWEDLDHEIKEEYWRMAGELTDLLGQGEPQPPDYWQRAAHIDHFKFYWEVKER